MSGAPRHADGLAADHMAAYGLMDSFSGGTLVLGKG